MLSIAVFRNFGNQKTWLENDIFKFTLRKALHFLCETFYDQEVFFMANYWAEKALNAKCHVAF